MPQLKRNARFATAFSKNLAKLLVASGMTAKDFAEQLGISGNAVFHFLHGNASPSLVTLAKMCQVLHVTPNEILIIPKTKIKD